MPRYACPKDRRSSTPEASAMLGAMKWLLPVHAHERHRGMIPNQRGIPRLRNPRQAIDQVSLLSASITTGIGEDYFFLTSWPQIELSEAPSEDRPCATT